MGYSTTTYGGVALDFLTVDETRRQKTLKHGVGNTLVILGSAVGSTALERVLILTGHIRGDIDALRTSLQALEDGQRHVYVDGVHNGDYAIQTGSLVFDDVGGRSAGFYTYIMTLVEW